MAFDPQEKPRLIGRFAAEIAGFGAHYLDEMRGIAEGAGVSLDDIVLVNARTEVVAQARREKNRPEAEDASPAPRTVSTSAPASQDTGGWRRKDDASTSDDSNQGGWRRVKPGEKP